MKRKKGINVFAYGGFDEDAGSIRWVAFDSVNSRQYAVTSLSLILNVPALLEAVD